MDFSKLISPEAIATYAVFVLGIILTVVAFFIRQFFNRAKPKKVKLLKFSESSLVKIDEEVQKDIFVSYKEEPISSLFLTVFQLYNPSNQEIDDININIVIQRTKIFKILNEDQIIKRGSNISSQDNIWDEDSSSSLILLFPYLNQEKLYNDKVIFKILSQDPINVKKIIGGGRGWKVDFTDRVKLSREFIEAINSSITGTNSFLYMLTGVSKSSINVFYKLLKLRKD